MDLNFGTEIEDFRREVRAFFETEYPADIREKTKRGVTPTKADYQRSEQALSKKGWLAVNWPAEYGGTGWTPEQKYVFDEELERAGALNVVPMGVIYVAPVIYTFGNDEQKKRWLPGILNSTTFWAQGYSEPEAGSDLASLQCKAERVEGGYVVNGTKIWTSLAQHADWIFCLTRTDNSGRKQEGITFLCSEMSAPGIAVHPIITIDGKHSLNRVTFDNVFIPEENRIGEEGKAWTYSTYLLANERTSYAHVAAKKEALQNLKAIAKTIGSGNRSLMDDAPFAQRIAEVEAQVAALEITVLRILSSLNAGEAPGDESSILKIMATESAQAITELYLEVAGAYGQPAFDGQVAPDWAEDAGFPSFATPAVSNYFGTRAQTIYGGTTEVQKNIIAKRVLGL